MTILATLLLALAVAVALASSVGVLAMNDALQRVHYVAPAATLSAVLVGVALAIDDRQAAAWTKVAVVVVLLFATNAVVSHATARAVARAEANQKREGAP